MNKVPAGTGDRAIVLAMYRKHTPHEFMQWIKNMYVLGNIELIIASFRFGNNRKMRETAKYMQVYQDQVVNFDMPSGWTCAKADICKTMAHRVTGKKVFGSKVLCFEAKNEFYAPSLREVVWINFFTMKALLELGVPVYEISRYLDYALEAQFPRAWYVRIHAGGDFFSPAYFQAIREWAEYDRLTRFFGYTKHFAYVLEQRPSNLNLVYSWGGLDDQVALEALGDGVKFGSNRIRLFDGDPDCEGLPIACGHDSPGDDIKYILAEQHFCIDIH